MTKLTTKQQKIIALIIEKGEIQSSAVRGEMLKSGENISLVTIKRALSDLARKKILNASGVGRSTSYTLATTGRVFADIDAKIYCDIEPDKRYGSSRYNLDLFGQMPRDLFQNEELKALYKATAIYGQRTKDLSATLQKKELERLIIELSWKSSKIEGNTYTLLDTEKLILENKEAVGHSKSEAAMILNHKDAFNFIVENIKIFTELNRTNLEKLHAILVKDLGVSIELRKSSVGIVGSKYRPLDNVYQIQDAVEALAVAIKKTRSPYAKALLAVLGISYIQPFEDGNKRTGRLMANALLLAHKLAPLSYRNVDEADYRAAMIVFYELNSIIPFKKIFINQYEFAAGNYAVKL